MILKQAIPIFAGSMLLLAAGALWAAERRGGTPPPAPSTQPTAYDYKDRYSILYQRNIFLKDRSRPSSSNSRPSFTTRPSAPPPREASLLLTGVVLEEGEMRAYIEDTANSKILRLVCGETVARGRIVDIDINGIEYETDGQKVWVEVGRTFTGLPLAAGGGSPTTMTASAGAATVAPLPNPNDPSLTLEQRMKLRRMQELNRK